MSRRFGWAMLVAVGIVWGGALNSYDRTHAATARNTAAEDQDMDAADQLREIKTQVKEINALLRSGTIRVITLGGPGAK